MILANDTRSAAIQEGYGGQQLLSGRGFAKNFRYHDSVSQVRLSSDWSELSSLERTLPASALETRRPSSEGLSREQVAVLTRSCNRRTVTPRSAGHHQDSYTGSAVAYVRRSYSPGQEVTMIGRRVAVLLQLPAQSRLLLANRSQSQHDLPLRTLFYQPRRLYATPGRPRKAVGEPSRPVKRAVKRSAAKATSPEESPAKQKVEAKKKSAAKKPAAKKAAAPKKQLTEEQRAAKAVKLDQAKIADLKKAALSPPKVTRSNAYLQFTAEKGKELKGLKSSSVADIRKTVGDHMKSSAAQWKQLSAAELEVCIRTALHKLVSNTPPHSASCVL